MVDEDRVPVLRRRDRVGGVGEDQVQVVALRRVLAHRQPHVARERLREQDVERTLGLGQEDARGRLGAEPPGDEVAGVDLQVVAEVVLAA